MTKTVATASDVQIKMVACAKMVRTLCGGTVAMRVAGKEYLPKAEAESEAAYKSRLARSVLFGATRKTVEDMTGKVFTKPVVLQEDVPPALVKFAENVDLTGRHINVFARDAFDDAMEAGIGHILTDMPPAVVRTDGAKATLADEQEAGIRPYLVYIPMERLVGWKSETKNGAEVLTQIRIKECVTEPDGEFHEKEVEQIRVIEPGTWRTFRKGVDTNKPEEWAEHANGTSSLNKIALATIYINRTDFMRGEPPLQKIAELNVAHWQSDSDQRNILHVARVPILFGAGFMTDDKFKIGGSEAIISSNHQAKLEYVEHTGQAITSGKEDLETLEFRMQTMGLQLLVPKPGAKTATGEIRDDAKENSPLAMMARALQDALELSFGFMAEYANVEMPVKDKDAGGSIIVNTDFGIQAGSSSDLQQILDAYNSGLISKETAWMELQRRGFLSDSFKADVEKERIASEPPPLNSKAAMDLGEDDDDDDAAPPAKKPAAA